jgi:hypothetical protein
MPRISIDIPLAEITLRKYEKPQGLSDRELVRKVCLSLGLLQPGDSRDIIVDILHVLLRENRELSCVEVEQLVITYRQQNNLPLLGIAPSNIRRQLLRLRDLFMIEKIRNNYRVTENAKLSDLFAEKLETYYLQSIIGRIKEYISEADTRFLASKSPPSPESK